MNIKTIIMNKQIMLAVGMIMFIGAMVTYETGAFFSDTATAEANVFTAGTLELKIAKNSGSNTPTGGWLDSQTAPWNFSAMAPGGTPDVSSVWLKNTGAVDGMKIGIAGSNSVVVGPNMAPQLRITKLTFDGSNLLEGGAGATIGDYVEPTGCTVTATPGNLVATVGAATAGSVVCVDSGSYSPGTLAISTSNITLVGLYDPNGGSAAKVTGEIDVTGSNVTVRGLNITNPAASYGVNIHGGAQNVAVVDNVIHDIGTTLAAGSAQAVSLQNGGAGGSNYTFTGNRIYNVGNLGLVHSGSGSAKGIYLGDTGAAAISNVTIENNIINHIQASGVPWPAGRGAYGILTNVNGGTNGLVVKNNSIYDLDGLWSTAVGLERLTNGAQVTYNDIHTLVNHKVVDDSNGVKVEDNAGTGIVIQHNNLPVAYGVNKVNSTGSINAKFNWWGDFDPSDQVYTSGPTINTSSFAGGPIAGLVGGTDFNGNGFADLQDLANTPIVGAMPGLNAGEEKQLVMGVQVDGPTTDNSFQGSSLNTNLTFTLNQI